MGTDTSISVVPTVRLVVLMVEGGAAGRRLYPMQALRRFQPFRHFLSPDVSFRNYGVWADSTRTCNGISRKSPVQIARQAKICLDASCRSWEMQKLHFHRLGFPLPQV